MLKGRFRILFKRIDIPLHHMSNLVTAYVVTLALGSQPKQGLAKVRAKREARESHLMLPGV
jgi:hypothetical protein